MDNCVTELFPNRLRELRKAKKVNQEQLAEDLDIGRASISNYEIGSRIPDADVVVALADYFCVSTDYLLGRTSMPKETLEGTAELISVLAEISDTLTPDRKGSLFRILLPLSEILSRDIHREDDRYILGSYADIIECLQSFDRDAELIISDYLFFQAVNEKDQQSRNISQEMLEYFAVKEKIDTLTLTASETISRILLTNIAFRISWETRLFTEWGEARDTENEGDQNGNHNKTDE